MLKLIILYAYGIMVKLYNEYRDKLKLLSGNAYGIMVKLYMEK